MNSIKENILNSAKPVYSNENITTASDVQGSAVPCNQVIHKFSINNLILTPKSPEETKEFEEIVNGTTVEEETDEEDVTVELFVEKEIDNVRKFYDIFSNDIYYGINLRNYMRWRKSPGAGKEYKKNIDSISFLGKLVMVINEREKMSECSKLMYIADQIKDKKKMGFPVTADDLKIYDDLKFNKWRFECHKIRYFYIRKYFKDNCNFDIAVIKKEDDIRNYYKKELASYEYNSLNKDKIKSILKSRKID